METPTNCPLCQDAYVVETDLRVHLEVEHRKSELAAFVVKHGDVGTDPTVERERTREEREERTRERDARAPTV